MYLSIHLSSGPSPESCLYFQDFQESKFTDQSSFYEIRGLTICINIKAFKWINRKQLNIQKIFYKYLEFCIVPY